MFAEICTSRTGVVRWIAAAIAKKARFSPSPENAERTEPIVRAFTDLATYAFSDDLTLIRGSHQFGFGGTLALSEWKTRTNSRSGGSFAINGGATGLSLADFMAGRVFEFRQANPFTNDATQRTFGIYGQDTWRVSDEITMNYGMRWEPWFPQEHTKGTVYNFSTSAFSCRLSLDRFCAEANIRFEVSPVSSAPCAALRMLAATSAVPLAAARRRHDRDALAR